MKPVMAAATTAGATDEQLVAAIRAGSDEALETLFLRYRDRIAAYVRGIVTDQGKSEDIVQETFISALRSLKATDRAIAFRPWIYQIARNACIDYLRRQRRAQEVSLDSDDFRSQDERLISQAGQSTHRAVSQREDMDTLQQAFGSLPASQHEILVLREFEGLSYAEIATRMRLSPAAVESMLFRARRGLKDEFDEISTGERCRRMHALIAAVAEGVSGARDRQALSRHVRFCAVCRREAASMGLGALVSEALRRGRVRRALHRVAALFPIPPFLHRRGDDATSASLAERLGARVQAPLSQLGLAGSPAAEQAASAIPKAVAVVATAALIGSGGLVGQQSEGASAAPSPFSNGASVAQPGFPGQPPAGSTNGSVSAAMPPGSGAGLLRSQAAAGSGPAVSAPQHGGFLNFDPAGPAGPGGPTGAALPNAAGILGPTLTPRGGAGTVPGIRDRFDKAVPPALGGVSVPRLPGGGSPPRGGDGGPRITLPDRVVPEVPRAPKVDKPKLPGNSELPSVPSLPKDPLPATPAPQVTPRSLPGTDPVTGALQGTTGPNLNLPLP
jgi:RNA polymerase sigma factor (sigma-70 family)